MSRREIDALVDDVLRAERDDAPAGPARPQRVEPPRPRRPRSIRRRAAVVWAIVALVCAVGFIGRAHGEASASYLYSEVGLPQHPTTYGDGSYRFIRSQPQNPDLPVGYNPCRYIDVEINYLDATPTIREDTVRTLRMIEKVSGLHLRYVGASTRTQTDPPSGRLLVSFIRHAQDPSMTDAIAGHGGSLSYAEGEPGQTMYYVGGIVTFNADTYNNGPHDAQLLVLAHEFGHALGLAHAPGAELMNADPWPYGLSHYAHGDLTGLAKLGALPCR